MYENTREFLTEQITENQLIPKIRPSSTDDIIAWWKKKAINRYEKLHTEKLLKPEMLFYNDMHLLTWDEAKAKYLGEVGR